MPTKEVTLFVKIIVLEYPYFVLLSTDVPIVEEPVPLVPHLLIDQVPLFLKELQN